MDEQEARQRWVEAKAKAVSIADKAKADTTSLDDAKEKALQTLRESAKARNAALIRRTAIPHWVSVPDIAREVKAILPEIRLRLFDLIVGESPWPLVLIGETGAGKTCTALCLHDYFQGWYTTLADLHQRRNECLGERLFWDDSGAIVVRMTEFWSQWEKAGLCTVDEIGIREPTEAGYETLKSAIDRREQRPLIIITNLNMREIDALYDDRIASRLIAGTVLEMTGDRRLECAKSQGVYDDV
jgi:hypothetical protein